MDVAVELEENYEENNYTFNETERIYYNGLYPHQIGLLFFSAFCLIPNILIVYIICRNKLLSPVYWTIANWSILNIILVLDFLPITIIPAEILSGLHALIELIVYFGVTFATFTGFLAMLFMFDFFVEFEKICKYSIAGIWTLILCFTVAVTVIETEDLYGTPLPVVVLEIMGFLIIIVSLMKVIHSSFRQTQEESKALRVRLCSKYLICMSLVWATDFALYMHRFFIFVTLLATIVLYLDGWINLIILVYFDARIKRHFMQMFCGSKNYVDLKFDARSSVVQIVDQPSRSNIS